MSCARKALAASVHIYTASGVLLAFLAVGSITGGDYRSAFLWLFAATVVDATDGYMARWVRVREVLPAFDGRRLDDIVDYVTFVFVPALILYRTVSFPPYMAGLTVAAVLLSSAYGFGQADAKSTDNFFTGFPSYWNVVAFYLHVVVMPPAFNAVLVLALSVLVFIPIGYVYPSRTPVLRILTVTLCSVWGGLVLLSITQIPHVSRRLLGVSLFFPLYYVVLSVVLHERRSKKRGVGTAFDRDAG